MKHTQKQTTAKRVLTPSGSFIFVPQGMRGNRLYKQLDALKTITK